MINKFKICTVVQGKTLEEFLKNLKKAHNTASMVELRADTIIGLRLKEIELLRTATKLPSIFTFRHTSESGLYYGTIKKQSQVLNRAFDLGFEHIDISIGNPLINKISVKEKKRLLLSYHNVNETPDLPRLQTILRKMRAIKPAIIKIATLVTKKKDIATLTKLLSDLKRGEKMIVIGMGNTGRITRTSFPKLGSYITFVQMKGEKAIAPGILTL